MGNLVELSSRPGYRYRDPNAAATAMRAMKPSDYCKLGDMKYVRDDFKGALEEYLFGARLLQKELERKIRGESPPYGRRYHRSNGEIAQEQELMNQRIAECNRVLGISGARRAVTNGSEPLLRLVKS